MRLSPKQLGLLRETADNGTLPDGKPIPLYIRSWSRFDSYLYEREAFAYARNLESRGLLRIEQDCFLHITPEGRLAVEKAGYRP